ncbi:MAG: DinB family protein [Candidatus Promineifilaceae bacterium]|nr:DinB family protein [Candidatus Promineifilaceae bacterium]
MSQEATLPAELSALAAKLEGEGQYNLGKLLRAAGASLTWEVAYQQPVPAEREALVEAVAQARDRLASIGASQGLLSALTQGAAALADGRLPLIHETPDPYVCRTCGYLLLSPPVEPCPRCQAQPATFRHYVPMYWLEALDPFEALTALRETPDRVANLLQDAPDTVNGTDSDGQWGVRQLMAHLYDAETLLHERIRRLLAEDNPSLSSAATFELATQEAQRPPTTQAILTAYRRSRQETLNHLEALPLSDWWRAGRHEEFGTVTVGQQASYFAVHEITHLTQLERLR